jgi:hypothetical protein
MNDTQNLTAPESARTIMGDNFISLEEALTVFPCRKQELIGYETIPFSRELLYFCSEPENPFILVPGIARHGSKNKPLTIVEMRNHFSRELPNLFAPCPALEDPISVFTNNNTCFPTWYLLSKNVLEKEKIDRFFKKLEMKTDADGNAPWCLERAVVYIHAWILFLMLRNEEIFAEAPIHCADYYGARSGAAVCIQFINRKIVIAKDAGLLGIVPSVNTYLK